MQDKLLAALSHLISILSFFEIKLNPTPIQRISE